MTYILNLHSMAHHKKHGSGKELDTAKLAKKAHKAEEKAKKHKAKEAAKLAKKAGLTPEPVATPAE